VWHGACARYTNCSTGGPPRYSEIRINLAQAFNGVGTVVAPVLASYVFFKNTGTDQSALQNVQWTYLAIACFVFLLAVVYYFSPIPEITGMDYSVKREKSANK
jgi:FHS family L-fucose permease-like MFS transporter